MGAKRVSKQGVTVSQGNAIEVTNTAGTVLFSVNNAGSVNTLANLTAKGDLLTASAASTPAVLAAPTEQGSTLVADSAASTGLRWQSAYNGNAIINGGMDFWQRGTSFTSASVYTADRWFKGSQTGFTVSRQTASLDGFQYSLRLQRDSGTSNTVGMGMYHNIETQESLRFANKTVVVSFWAKCGANYSPTSSLLGYILYTGTGTDQARTQSVGFTGEAQPASGTVTLTTSWQRFSFTATIASTATEICFNPYMNNTGTAGANDWFEITGVQLELGSAPTTFKRAGGTIQSELAACQRYFYQVTAGNNYIMRAIDASYAYQGVVYFPVVMRTSPTLVSGATFAVNTGSAGTVGLDGASTFSVNVYNSSSNWTANAAIKLTAGFSAEL
jgi:hypothetical protein